MCPQKLHTLLFDKIQKQKSNILMAAESKKAELKRYLDKWWKVKINDGRLLHGKCLCVDQWMNIILSQTREYYSPTGHFGEADAFEHGSDEEDNKNNKDSDIRKRNVGLVMVPGKHVVNISVENI